MTNKSPIQNDNTLHLILFFLTDCQSCLYLSNSHKLLGEGHESLKLTLAQTLEWLSTMSLSWEWVCNRKEDSWSTPSNINSTGHNVSAPQYIKNWEAKRSAVLQCIHSLLWQTASPQPTGTGECRGGPPQAGTAGRGPVGLAYGPASLSEPSSILNICSGALKEKGNTV